MDQPPQIHVHVHLPLELANGLAAVGHLLEKIIRKQKEHMAMSSTTQTTVDRIAADVVALKAEVQADVAGVATQVAALKQQIADLQAGGSGATADQLASLNASAADIEATVQTLHDGLNPPAPAP